SQKRAVRSGFRSQMAEERRALLEWWFLPGEFVGGARRVACEGGRHRRDSCCRPQPLETKKSPRDSSADNGDGQRHDESEHHGHYLSANSTATSTTTSTGSPTRRAGAKRHSRTAATAR